MLITMTVFCDFAVLAYRLSSSEIL